MEWKPGDSLRVLRKGDTLFFDGRTGFARVVMEVRNGRLTLRRKVNHGDRMPTEKVLISDVELWWKEGYISVSPATVYNDGEAE